MGIGSSWVALLSCSEPAVELSLSHCQEIILRIDDNK